MFVKCMNKAEEAIKEFDSLTPEEREEELEMLKHRKQVFKEGIERTNNIVERSLS